MNGLPILHSPDSEQAVVGRLLLHPSAWDEVSDLVSESDFFDDSSHCV